MTDDPRSLGETSGSNQNASPSTSDEALVEALYAGDKSALEILFNRYNTPILSHLFGISFFANDEPYLEDIRQKVLMTISEELSRKKFASLLIEGSFKKWVYKITYFACMNADKERRGAMKTLSEAFPEEETNLSDLVSIRTTPTTSDYEEVEEQLNEVLPRLTKEELRLMELVSQKVPYQEILPLPEFKRYSLDYLKHKIYNIRKRMRGKEDK